MANFSLTFVEKVEYVHDFVVEVDDYLDLDGILDEIESECDTFDSILEFLEQIDGVEILNHTEGCFNGDCELTCDDVMEL